MLIPNNKALKDKLAKDEYELVLTLSNTTLTNQSIPNSKILQDSFSVNRFSVTGGTIEVGSATSAEMQVTIDNSDGSFDEWTFEGATIFARLKATINDSAEYMDIGYFIVDEVVRQRDSIQLVCLDKMVWFDKAIVWSVEPNDGGFVFSSSPATLLSNICSACNVSYDSASFTANAVNQSVTLAAPTSENLTYRQLLQWLCQVIGVCAYINESGALTVAWYAQKTYSGEDAEDRAAQDIITPSNRFSSTIDRDPITISNVSVKVGETTHAANSNNSYTLAIEGNELIDETNYASILSSLATRLVGLSYYPFTADVLGLQWLQPLDITTFVDKDDVEHTVIITDWTYSRGRNTQLAGKGESATRKGYASNPPFTAAQQRIIEEIKKNTPEVDIDDRIEAVFALNNAVNNGMMLHSTTVDGKVYYHNAATLADSDLIATANTGGFAWTTSGWNSGNPSWSYGISNDGAAVLQTLSTYSLNADLITAGQIDASQIDVVNLDASNITTGTISDSNNKNSIDMDTGELSLGNGAITYNPTTGVFSIASTVAIGGLSDAAEQAVQTAVQNGTIKAIDHQETAYVVSNSGTVEPGSSAAWQSTIPTVPSGQYLWMRVRTYYSDHTAQNPSYDDSLTVVRQGVDGTDASVIRSTEVMYSLSNDGTEPPADDEEVSELTAETVDLYFSTTNGYTTAELKTELETNWPNTVSRKMFGLSFVANSSRFYRFKRTDYSNGDPYTISDVQFIGRAGGDSAFEVSETGYVVTNNNNSDYNVTKRANTNRVSNYQYGKGSLVNDVLTSVDWGTGDRYEIRSFNSKMTDTGYSIVSNTLIANLQTAESVLGSATYYVADSVADITTERANYFKENWFTISKSPCYYDCGWSSSLPYLKKLTMTYRSGWFAGGAEQKTITDVQLVAIYGSSYPEFDTQVTPPGYTQNWYSTPPDVSSAQGMYLWTRTTYTYDSGDPVVQYRVDYIPKDSDGKGISSVKQYYKASDNGISAPSGTWYESPSASGVGFSEVNRYLWTYTTTNYTDGTSQSTSKYVVGVWGRSTGDPGEAGRGIVSIVHQYYLSTSNTTQAGGSWSETPAQYVSGRYYWERDVITYDKAYNGSTTQTTTAVLSNGLNKAILDANEANAAIGEWCYNNDKTYINGAKIYTGTITANKIAANTITSNEINTNKALIDALMANSVDVTNGDVTITQAAANITESNMTSSFVDTFCQQRYGKSFSQLSPLVRPYAYMLAVAAYVATVAATAANNGKLVVQTNDETQKAALYPNLLLFTNSGNSEFSYYGNDAMVAGNAKIVGSLAAGNIQKGNVEVDMATSPTSRTQYTGSVSFDRTFDDVPVVVCTPMNLEETYHQIIFDLLSISKTGFTYYINVPDNWNYIETYGHFYVSLQWIAMS